MLLDTNIFIDYLRGFPPALSFFKSIQSRDDVCFSTITEAELLAGAANNDASVREKLLHFIHSYEDVPLNHSVAVLAGDLKRSLGLALPDALIAATALEWNAELITRNAADFKKVPDLRVKVPY